MISIRSIALPRSLDDEQRKLFKNLGILFAVILFSYKLPHDSYSISQYILRPIEMGNTTVYLSGIISFILVLYCILNILSLEKYKYRSKLVVFLVLVIIIMPIMKWTIDIARTNYYWLMGDGLQAIDIEDANISYGSGNNSNVLTINIDLTIKDYGRVSKEFRVRVYLSERLQESTGMEYLDLVNSYVTHSNRGTINVSEDFMVEAKDATERMLDSKITLEEVKYKIYNGEESVTIIHRDYM